ncbi:MAG TPA: rhomboid family intramembrane serine protease [Planctomycetota bacterium]|nr:rhomboid family intramembrane serine protease [Planctomycetota bacterium]
MFFPYADENPPHARKPWVNWALIAVNVLIFFQFAGGPEYRDIVMRYGFKPAQFEPLTLLTSLFLHGGFMHIAGNMWFLFLFGDNVERRCGHLLYFIAYIMCGVAGDISHFVFFPNSNVPSIGASGAIFGVLGMYLFFFPRNRIKVIFFIFFFIQRAAISAIWVIGLWFVFEVISSSMQTMGGVESGVGHLAHSGGFVVGAALAGIFTMLGLVEHEDDHLLAVMSGRARPRRSYSSDDEIEAAEYRLERSPYAAPVDDGRGAIVQLLHAGRTDEARRAWRRYAFDHAEGVLPVREQLEVALALDKNGERGVARDAYERLINAYPNEQPFAAEANLALAGMLLQELKESGDAREVPMIQRLLLRAAETHPQQNRRALAQKWLEALAH